MQEGYCSWVCLSVCVSVTSNLTLGASLSSKCCHVLSGQQRSKNRGVFSENRFVAEIQHCSIESHRYSRPFSAEVLMCIICGREEEARPVTYAVHGDTVLMPPSKVCPQWHEFSAFILLVNPWRACAARVTVVVLCVCLSVC